MHVYARAGAHIHGHIQVCCGQSLGCWLLNTYHSPCKDSVLEHSSSPINQSHHNVNQSSHQWKETKSSPTTSAIKKEDMLALVCCQTSLGFGTLFIKRIILLGYFCLLCCFFNTKVWFFLTVLRSLSLSLFCR